MNLLLLLMVFIIILIIVLCEMDRNFMIKHKFYNYYFKHFPIQIYNGIHNSIFKLYCNKIIYDPNKFKFHKYLIKNKINIRNEFINSNKKLQVFAHDTTNMLKKDLSYKYVQFKIFNKIYKKNLDNFPAIQTFLTSFPNVRTCFYSIMTKPKIINYHRGPYSGIIRYHIPIIIDNPYNCYIEVLGKKKLYYNKSFMFDDNYPHKLVKKDNSLRVVLICDIDNPYSYHKLHSFLY